MLTTLTPPSTYPITVALAKQHLHVDSDDGSEDTYIEMLISAATNYAEELMDRALLTQTLRYEVDVLANQLLVLPRPPLQEIVTVTTGESEFSNYSFVGATGTTVLKGTWEASRLRVDFIAGYGDTATDVPASIRHGLLQATAYMYANRGDMVNNSGDRELLTRMHVWFSHYDVPYV